MITMETSTWSLICVVAVLALMVFSYAGYRMGRDHAEKLLWDANIFPEMDKYELNGKTYVRPKDPRRVPTIAICMPEDVAVVSIPYSEVTHHVRTSNREDPMVIDFALSAIVKDLRDA